LLEAHAQSGQTLKSFAEAKGLNAQRLGWWRKKFTREQAIKTRQRRDGAKTSVPEPKFVSVVSDRELTREQAVKTQERRGDAKTSVREPKFVSVVPDREAMPSASVGAPSRRGGYEVMLGETMTLRVPEDFEDQTLARILRVLRVAP
jgi:hypothetical protein